jgi:hypothetical protein
MQRDNSTQFDFDFTYSTLDISSSMNSSPTLGYPNYIITTTNGTSSLNNYWGNNESSELIVNGDIRWKGRSLEETMKKIEDRLAILVPDPEKLEHFKALKKAYDHYKVLEALCQMPFKEEK